MPTPRKYLDPMGPRGGSSAPSISLDCKEERHTVCIYEWCECCHEGQEYVHGHWRKIKEKQ